jgi:hypothetical protein
MLILALAAIALVRMADTAQTVSEEKTIRTTQLAELYKLREALGQTGIAARMPIFTNATKTHCASRRCSTSSAPFTWTASNGSHRCSPVSPT